jgi:drug/metabolite transporter (DMT)-like permease
MTAASLALVLAAAVIHAVWNLLAKRAGGGAVFVWAYGTVAAAVLTPPAVGLIATRDVTFGASQITYIAAGALIHVAYFLALQQGYRLGDLSVVYPVARGTGPVLTTVAAVLLLGERPSALALTGAALVAAGVFVLTRPTRSRVADADADTRRAVAYGLLTGLLIAAYTVCDKQAVSRYGVPPVIQQWVSSLALAGLLAPLALRHRREVGRVWAESRWEAVGIGVLCPLGYVLILAAMTVSPVSYVAPAREVSILFATVLGTRVLSEGGSSRRLAAAAAMVAGVAALALG